ncbi:hypothetical protein ACU5DF_23595 [Aliivibrio wodanis]|uniref:hypothetical protein n=1 Tax=Aliivibrio wodanis TaxID=80852 RepID=UPI00406C292C
MLRPQDKRTGFNQGNNLSKLQKNEGVKKTFTFASGKKVSATRIVVPAVIAIVVCIFPILLLKNAINIAAAARKQSVLYTDIVNLYISYLCNKM